MNEQWVVPILTGTSVIAIGGSLILNRVTRRAPLEARLAAVGRGGTRGIELPLGDSTPGSTPLGVIPGLVKGLAPKETSVSLREQLTQAGFHNTDAAAFYMGSKILLVAMGVVSAFLIVSPLQLTFQYKVLLSGVIVGTLFFIPNMFVAWRRSNRRGLIRRHLPDAIDLLEICCSAGMGLDQSWNAVTDEVRTVCPTLADEMALTNLEIHLGATRTDAMKHMALRTGAEELSSLVAMLLQAERFGSSIAEGLQAYATYMRETRSQTMQEAAEKMAIKLIFPMVIAIFPAVVLLMAGPAFISLYRATRPG